MKAEDLRIGNILERGVVAGITTEFVEYAGMAFDGAIFDVANEKPVKLTEEWLVRFGFSECQCKDAIWGWEVKFAKAEWFILIDEGQFRIRSMFGDEDAVLCPVEIEHVHQLQNLYHALTGKELEVKQ